MDQNQQNNPSEALKKAAEAFSKMSKSIAERVKKMALMQRLFNNKATKHDASKKGYTHKIGESFRQNTELLPTNHERVVIARAARLSLSTQEYEAKYQKGE